MARDFAVEREWHPVSDTDGLSDITGVSTVELFAVLDRTETDQRALRVGLEQEFHGLYAEWKELMGRLVGDEDGQGVEA